MAVVTPTWFILPYMHDNLTLSLLPSREEVYFATFYLFIYLFIFFWPHLQHLEVPRPGRDGIQASAAQLQEHQTLNPLYHYANSSFSSLELALSERARAKMQAEA